MNIFEDISLEQASSLVSESLHKSDDGELYIEDTVSESFIYDDGRLKNANYDNIKGFGVRYVSGETTGYANSTILTKASLEKALSTITFCSIFVSRIVMNCVHLRVNRK